MTRALTGKLGKNVILGGQDFLIAKETLKRKFVIGLFDRMEASIERFENFSGWRRGYTCVPACRDRVGGCRF